MKYKEGDRVKIKSLDWYNENKDEYGYVRCIDFLFTPEHSKYCGCEFTISHITEFQIPSYLMESNGHEWTDEMIEGLVEEECPQDFIEKYCKSCGTQRCDRTKEFFDGCPYYNAYMCKKQNNAMEEKCDYVRVDNIPDVIQTKTASACSHNGFYGYSDSEGNETSEWYLPDGYQFVDENGNVIEAKKIVLEKKKKEYPKTYCECKDILGLWDIDDTERGYYKTKLIDKLQMLLICRDAYWKIAGEEMGLGKPWEPDWKVETSKYIILCKGGEIQRHITCKHSRVLAFPAEEMRDVFYENFKELIESCKELL